MSEGRPTPLLLKRISRAFGLQALFITVAVILSVFVVRAVLEEVLIRQALELEATFFADQLAESATAALPRTRNLRGFIDGGEPAPPLALSGLTEGLHLEVLVPEVDTQLSHPVHVSKLADGRRLYLVFSAANVDRLVFYFGVIPLVVALLLVYLGAWLAFRLSRQALSPIISLARRVQRLQPGEPLATLSGDFREGEAATLANAFDEFAHRIEEFVSRERQFTADASHELRTPVTVIGGAAEMLENESALSPRGRDRVAMIRRSVGEIKAMIETLLALAREERAETPEFILVNEVIAQLVADNEGLIEAKAVSMEVELPYDLNLKASRGALTIVLGNLIRNACLYTEEGHIRITVTGDRVVVTDTGPGIPDDDLGYALKRGWRRSDQSQDGSGIGLALAERFCQRYGWQLRLENRTDRSGLQASLIFFH